VNVSAQLTRQLKAILIPINCDDKSCAQELGARSRTQADGSLREDNYRIAELDLCRLCTAKSGRIDVGKEHDLLVGQLVWNFGQAGLRVWHQ
jgi:hypothetical protein